MALVLFNRLESANGLSVVGGNMTTTGTPTFGSGKFGNGHYSASSSNYSTLPIVSANTNAGTKFCLEFWFYTDWACTNGSPGDGVIHLGIDVFVSSAQRIKMYFYPGDALYVECGNGQYFRVTTGLSWSASVLHHFALVVNTAGIAGGSDKVQVYLDNVKVGNSTTATFAITGDPSIYICKFGDTALYAWKGLIDNIKLYNTDKTDFSDRFNERAGLADQVICV